MAGIENHMDNQEKRLSTFYGVDKLSTIFQLRHLLAKKGFYATRNGEETKCYKCGKAYPNWLGSEGEREVELIHTSLNENCRLVKLSRLTGEGSTATGTTTGSNIYRLNVYDFQRNLQFGKTEVVDENEIPGCNLCGREGEMQLIPCRHLVCIDCYAELGNQRNPVCPLHHTMITHFDPLPFNYQP